MWKWRDMPRFTFSMHVSATFFFKKKNLPAQRAIAPICHSSKPTVLCITWQISGVFLCLKQGAKNAPVITYCLDNNAHITVVKDRTNWLDLHRWASTSLEMHGRHTHLMHLLRSSFSHKSQHLATHCQRSVSLCVWLSFFTIKLLFNVASALKQFLFI